MPTPDDIPRNAADWDDDEIARNAYADQVDTLDLGFDREPTEPHARPLDAVRFINDHHGTRLASVHRCQRAA